MSTLSLDYNLYIINDFIICWSTHFSFPFTILILEFLKSNIYFIFDVLLFNFPFKNLQFSFISYSTCFIYYLKMVVILFQSFHYFIILWFPTPNLIPWYFKVSSNASIFLFFTEKYFKLIYVYTKPLYLSIQLMNVYHPI